MTLTKRPRRILGQCNRVDFREIEHLAITLKNPELLDASTLTNRQKFAYYFVHLAQRRFIPWELLIATVEEVLFWGDDDAASVVEIKFVPDESKMKKIAEFKRLW